MLGLERIKQISGQVLSRSGADQLEVVVTVRDQALTRFANSAIHQNVAEVDTEVKVRAVVGKRVGIAATNNLEKAALAQTFDKALALARLQPENPDFRSLPGPQPVPAVVAYSAATASYSPEQRARAVGVVCQMTRSAGLSGSGALTTRVLELAVVNSLGTFAYLAGTHAELSTVVMGDSGSGYAAALSVDVNGLDFEAVAREAVDKCRRSQDPRPFEPGEYTVILEPYAVQDFLSMMAWTGFSATAYQEGRSFMSGRLGQQIVDPRLSIWDDGQDPSGMPLAFDFEGVPKQRVDLITGGVAQGVVYDSYRAGKEGKASTGHALPAPNGWGPMPLNLHLGTGDSSVEEMIRSTERGLYVTRFHYTRPVEPTRLVVTGMTRDGTFVVDKGEVGYPVRNLRFTQSYLEALNHLEGIGAEAKLVSGLMGVSGDRVPALKLSKFNFTGVTEF